jgi:hypothetical protein
MSRFGSLRTAGRGLAVAALAVLLVGGFVTYAAATVGMLEIILPFLAIRG